MSINILLADDHMIVRDGICALLEAQGDMKIIGTVDNGREAVAAAKRLQPDVSILDIGMPQMNGIEATQLICKALPNARVLILSMHGDSEHVYRALQAGARGYLLKESAGTLLVAALRAVYAGRRYLSESVNDMVMTEYLGFGHAVSPLSSLSQREREILQLVVEGVGNADVAKRLFISIKTVETYRSRLMQKLGIGNVPELVRFAISHGITQLK